MDNFSNIKSSFILPLQIFCLVLLFSFNAISVPPFGAVEINDKTQWLEGASLKTDSTVDELMARAKQFSDQGRYDLASSLWQKVIDSSNDLVFGSDEWLEKTSYELIIRVLRRQDWNLRPNASNWKLLLSIYLLFNFYILTKTDLLDLHRFF